MTSLVYLNGDRWFQTIDAETINVLSPKDLCVQLTRRITRNVEPFETIVQVIY